MAHLIALSNRLLATTQHIYGTSKNPRRHFEVTLPQGRQMDRANLTWEKGELGVVLPDEFSPKFPLTY